jgi:hypothetical protein
MSFVSALVKSDGSIESKIGGIKVEKLSEGVVKVDYSCLQCTSNPMININVYGKDVKFDLFDVSHISAFVSTKQMKKKDGDFKILYGSEYQAADLPIKVQVISE